MTIIENINIAFNAIRANLLRAVLTLLIIAFGIMALVGILTSIDAIKSSLTNNLASMGTNTFNVIRKGTGLGGGRHGRRSKVGAKITFKQAASFKEKYQYPAAVSLSALGTMSAVVKYKKTETDPNTTVYGADENYLDVAGYKLSAGRNITALESNSGRNIVILGAEIAKKLFQSNSPSSILGKSLSIRNIQFKVIGIMEEKGSSMTFSGDKMVLIPLQTLRKYFGSQTSSYNLSVMVTDALNIEPAMAEAEGVFRRVRKIGVGEESDFEMEKSDGLISLIVDNTATLQMAAIFIGLITLLGAAIGLMNIMLVSVTERTREIGICKSLGATRRTILVQFLVEAIVICQIGGLVGIVFGIIAGNGVTYMVGGAFVVPWAWIMLGFTLCFIVGITSGLYPAVKASKLDPIEALRYE
ncbi:ABC transporter permease [Aureispira anguillae]|uniref:ABC transporter permease n=1 Tax=Aureispira anguillae TaxID=2864201 RepID=A0A915YIX6_9BACT|nr:ABC transporter permease [Aureispira anguillae]BDS14024.1 ABC transporter permease [Aureispira anguillae]